MHKRSLLHAADVLAPQPIHVAGYFDVGFDLLRQGTYLLSNVASAAA